MTERSGEPLGSGPDGLLIPGDLDDDPAAPALLAEPAYRGSPEERMERAETLLASLDRKVQGRLETGERILKAVKRAEDDRRSDFLVLRGKMLELSCDMARVPGDMATRHGLEDVERRQQNEFAWLRESHAWLRGAVTVGLPEQPGRSGVFAWCVLWAIAMLAVLAAGAVALGLVSVNISWTGPGLAQTASAVRPAPPRLDVAPGVVVPAGRERPTPEAVPPSRAELPPSRAELPPSRAELPPLLAAPDLNPGDVVPRVGSPPRFEEPARNPREFVLPPGEGPLREQHLDRVEERRRSMQAPPSLAVPPDLAPVDRKNVEEAPGREERGVGPDRQDFRVDAAP